ncbi:hypothetical protein U1707_00195 [Sphingomonas sp. PB2P12]|uniref:hypothetical protein n=1 Tax=Sphingomonas sandaracina TaxID=3096157 RepID=UPI002FC5F06E
MNSALDLLHEWTNLMGPNAIQLEILLDEPGYWVTISQQPELMQMRVLGIDTATKPLVFSMSITKRLDTKHPFLDNLAKYAREPVAPVLLTVATMASARGRTGRLSSVGFEPDLKRAILLPGIDVYLRREDRHRRSMVRLEDDERAAGPPPAPSTEPSALAAKREARLFATLPKTMFALRNYPAGKAVVACGVAAGMAPWQVEQAVCNLRLAAHLAYVPNGKAKRLAMLAQLREDMIEPANATFDATEFSADQIEQQAALDAGFLLRLIDGENPVPESLGARLVRLRELGHD